MCFSTEVGEETKRHHLLWVLLRYEGTVFEEMHSDAHQFTPEFRALCFKCSMYFPFFPFMFWTVPLDL